MNSSFNLIDQNHSLQVEKQHRFFLAQKADAFGYIPFVGTCIGLTRIIVSVAIAALSLFAVLASSFMDDSSLKEASSYLFLRASHETLRGVYELNPFWIRKKEAQMLETKDQAHPAHFAYGTFLYNPPKIHQFYYSPEALTGTWQVMDNGLLERISTCYDIY